MHGGTAKIMKDFIFNCLGITVSHIEEYIQGYRKRWTGFETAIT